MPPSTPKYRFLQHVGLANRDQRDIYRSMKGEVFQGWQRLQTKREFLLLNLQNNLSVQPPFTHGEIREDALDFEINEIYRTASPETKLVYDRAHEPGQVNWIIKWLLWHTFRHRDQRRKLRSELVSPTFSDDTSDSIDTQFSSPSLDAGAMVGETGNEQQHIAAGLHETELVDADLSYTTRLAPVDERELRPLAESLNRLLPLVPTELTVQRGFVQRAALPYDPIRDV